VDVLIGLLIGLLVLAIVLWLVWWILSLVPFPPGMEPLRTIVLLIVALIALLVVLDRLGLFSLGLIAPVVG
jgi:hypothetical protein